VRRRVLVTVAALVVIVIGTAVALKPSSPASWPEPTLVAWLREQTPFGTPEALVKQFLEDRGFGTLWAPGQDSLNRALALKFGVSGLKFSDGVRTIQAHIGEYRDPRMLFLFETSTEAFYGFDDSARLVDIRVRKSTDAP